MPQFLFSIVLCPCKLDCLHLSNQFCASAQLEKVESCFLKEPWVYLFELSEIVYQLFCMVCPVYCFKDIINRVELIISDSIFAMKLIQLISALFCHGAVQCIAEPVRLVFWRKSPDASWVSSYSADCGEMHHTLIITANVRGSLAAGRHGLSGRAQERVKTPKHHRHKVILSWIYMHICLCVCVLEGEFACWCECLHITQLFFLISQIGPGCCLGQKRQREGVVFCAVLLLPVTHICTHTHTHMLTSVFQKWLQNRQTCF